MKMPSQFDPEEMADLSSQFGLIFDPPLTAVNSVRGSDLLESGACAAYLDRLTETMQAPSRMIAASLFSKRYVSLTAVPVLYAMSAFNKGLEFPLEHTALEQPAAPSGGWSPRLRVSEWRVTEPAADRRGAWRSEIIGSLFAGSLAPLWRVLSGVATIPMSVLWENTAVRLFSLYEKRIGQGGGSRTRERVKEDFAYVIAVAPGSIFGEKENPLTPFYGPLCAQAASGQPVRIRKTCCFYYRVSADGSYCSNCPKAKPLVR
jgi:ferric iron reductase protein FhuF